MRNYSPNTTMMGLKNAIPPNPSAKPYAQTLSTYTTYMVAACNGFAMGLCQKGWRA